jgi:hypothetical protein
MAFFESGAQYRTVYKDKSRTINVLAADTPTTVGAAFIPVKGTGYTIYIQRILVHVKTAAAQAITFQDTTGTPIVLAVLPASAAIGDVHILLASEEGVPCGEGKNFEFIGTAGVAAMIVVEAFQKQTSSVSARTHAAAGAG